MIVSSPALLRIPGMMVAGSLVAVAMGCGAANETPAKPGDSSVPSASEATTVSWPTVDSAMGRAGVIQGDDLHRYNFPRSDLSVTVRDARGDVVLRPALALGGWIAMHATGTGTDVMAMGDLVLTEEELPRVMSRLQQGGVEQTAVHHHVMRESPRILYVHVHARGDAVQIAETVREAVALTSTPAAVPAPSPAAPVDLDTVAIAAALGHVGRSNGGVYQVSAPRPETIKSGGHAIPGAMGLGTVMNFQPTGNGRAAITGDFVMTAGEVNRVIRALRANDIAVTSLHNHMLDDDPRLFFMHFWAHDDAVKLARGLRAGLDSTAIRPKL